MIDKNTEQPTLHYEDKDDEEDEDEDEDKDEEGACARYVLYGMRMERLQPSL